MLHQVSRVATMFDRFGANIATSRSIVNFFEMLPYFTL